MAPPPPPTHITLTIKVPPGHLEGGADHFPLGSVAVNSTIAAVRQQIQQTIPSNPTPDKQRLLYGGRALVDSEQTLADALNTKRDPTQTEYVVHLLVKGEGQGSSTPAANGHRRVVSTPVGDGAQEQPQVPLPQPQAAEQTLHELHELQVRQHQEQVHRMMLQQQQQHLAQMGMGMPGGGMMPPNPFAGVQPMAGGLQMGAMQFPPGMPFPQQQQLPMMGQGFGQAVALGQQQRAAMGMHGVAPQGQPQGVPQHVGAAQNTNEAPPTIVNGQAGGNQQSENQGQPPNSHTTSATPTGANRQPGQQPQLQAPQQGHPRPVSGQGFHFEGIGPNGQRVQIHHQTMTFPGNAGVPGLPPFAQNPQLQQLPGPPMQPQLPMYPGPQPQAPPPSGPSSIDVARDNLAEMRRMVDEMRDSSASAEEQRNRIERLREVLQGVNYYIDPLHVHGATTNSSNRGNAPTLPQPRTQIGAPPPAGLHARAIPAPSLPGHMQLPPMHPFLNMAQRPFFGNHMQQPLRPPMNPSDTTCYLLSGPQGPQALLFSPQHGTYNGAFTQGAAVATSRPIPTPTTNATLVAQAAQQPPQNAQQQALAQLVQQPGQGHQPQPVPANPAAPAAPNAQQAAPAAAAAAAAAAADPNAPVQALFNHFWLLFRVLIFAYFLLGSNLGWRRPAALAVIGVGFWMVRAGLFGEGGVARRWWDGVVRVGPPAPAAGAAGGQPGAEGQGAARAGAMPTPEEVARRLIEERRDGRQQRLREFVRPVERAVALFVASLWPGIGQAHVREQEAEVQRRRDEEEVAGRRREEEARRVEEEREKERGGEGEKGSALVGAGGTEGSGTATGPSAVPATEGEKNAAAGSEVEGAPASGA
ncbi:hypothetical protein LTR87_014503 [Friedmanniomyces endolithicus]|nr:hypothetical protein LTR87_014503 [Friedmanniomyces endolithicus]